jgi:glycosyltransferase 2 family protein
MKKTLFGVLLGVSTLGFLVFYVGSEQLTDALLQAELAWLGIGMALKVPVIWCKAKRWAIAIERATGRHVRAAFTASMIGFAGNLVLPARLGEWARVSVLDKHNHMGRTLALSALIATQVFDLLLLVGCFLIAGTYVADRLVTNWHVAAIAFLTIVSVLVGVALLSTRVAALPAGWNLSRNTLLERLNRVIAPKFELCLKGISCLHDYRALTWILFLTFLAWVIETGSVFMVLLAFGIEATVFMAMMLVIVSNLSFLVPITPGNIGIAQAMSILVLAVFDVPAASALAYGVAHQGIFYAMVISLGLICFYREGMSVKLLGRSPRKEAPHRVAQTLRP